MEFADTNILLYAVVGTAGERPKADRALDILERPGVGLSVQVLQEFYVQATKPTRAEAITHAEAVALIETLLSHPVQSLTPALLGAALATRQRFQISYWDAAIVEAARALGCSTLLSEDLQDGMDFDGVRVENPFRDL